MASGDGLRVNPTGAFARDLKRTSKRGWNPAKLQLVIETLRMRQSLAPRHRDHALKGEWKGWRDCHVEPDWVLNVSINERENLRLLAELHHFPGATQRR